MSPPFVLVFVAGLIMAWALYGILVHLNAFTLRGGVISGALIWFGFVLPTVTANYAFGGRKAMLTVIDSGLAERVAHHRRDRRRNGDVNRSTWRRYSTFTPMARINLP